MKCGSCKINYGVAESRDAAKTCKGCGRELFLVEYWPREDIISDLNLALSQEEPIMLVAKTNCIIGFSWGYKLPIAKFIFLEGKIPKSTSYMDDIAVEASSRAKGVGTMLCNGYLQACKNKGINGIVLRTDQRNNASMTLFKKAGFSPIMDLKSSRGYVYDPVYPERIYLFCEVKR